MSIDKFYEPADDRFQLFLWHATPNMCVTLYVTPSSKISDLTVAFCDRYSFRYSINLQSERTVLCYKGDVLQSTATVSDLNIPKEASICVLYTIQRNEDNECVICLDNMRTHIAANCGHICICAQCKDKLLGSNSKASCPLCRTLTSFYHVYKST